MREIRQCPNCYEEFETSNRANQKTLCPSCVKERKKRRNLDFYNKNHSPKPCGYTIVDDPEEEGYFSNGVQIPLDDHVAMLRNSSYTEGTILERGGKQFRVVVAKNGRQRLKSYATPEHIYKYIEAHQGITCVELSKALGKKIGDSVLSTLESQGYYLSQDEKDKLYAVQRVDITPAPPTKHKVYNSTVELLDSLSVE